MRKSISSEVRTEAIASAVSSLKCPPELEGIEVATGNDGSGDVIEHIEKHARESNTRSRGKG